MCFFKSKKDHLYNPINLILVDDLLHTYQDVTRLVMSGVVHNENMQHVEGMDQQTAGEIHHIDCQCTLGWMGLVNAVCDQDTTNDSKLQEQKCTKAHFVMCGIIKANSPRISEESTVQEKGMNIIDFYQPGGAKTTLYVEE